MRASHCLIVATLAMLFGSMPTFAAGLDRAGLLASLRAGYRAASACPATAPRPVSPAGPSGRGALVPNGATSLLLCRYHGLNPPSSAQRLERARLVTASSQLVALTAEFDSLPKLPGVIHCPMDDGRRILATFRNPRVSTDVVQVGLAGCRIVSNGHVTRTATGKTGSRLLAHLTALVP